MACFSVGVGGAVAPTTGAVDVVGVRRGGGGFSMNSAMALSCTMSCCSGQSKVIRRASSSGREWVYACPRMGEKTPFQNDCYTRGGLADDGVTHYGGLTRHKPTLRHRDLKLRALRQTRPAFECGCESSEPRHYRHLIGDKNLA